MDIQEIQNRITPIISKYLPDEVKVEDITPEKDILKDLQINSAYLIDIVIAIEEEFDIAIDDDSIGKINTVQEAMEVIVGKINEAA
ncbi:MAG: acyl carrier protein [Flammeovirgaceae bacterium]|nr:acyl carrier protein [Flammeovirgaceae bacterium]MBR07565.1 acyl carrier protein [Rickettsiales bacterium]|tara:strand:- start:2867 stop:3124 length:258 start_codon:yes stop_codon:yes gene_type:complete